LLLPAARLEAAMENMILDEPEHRYVSTYTFLQNE
jgi:hypothetical protein